MTKTQEIIFSLIVVFALLLIAYFIGVSTQHTFGSAPSGLPATVATTSTATLTANTVILLFATSTCSARIISASSTALMLTFSDNQGKVPSGTTGIRQASSTTVVYDSGQFGCNALRAWSVSAETVGLMESN